MYHLVGPPIVVCNRLLQRCLVCGAKLKDSNDGPCAPAEPGTWMDEDGDLIIASTDVPTQNCLRLVE